MRLKLWQWVVLALPVVGIIGFLLVAASFQIHTWRLNWIWAVFTLLLLGWRWLLVRWTQPVLAQVEAVVAEVSRDLETTGATQVSLAGDATDLRAEATLRDILQASQSDRPIWEDWSTFWQRCQTLLVAIAQVYHPEVKYPLLNIYIPQAYGLLRGTVDDMDQWMQKLSPVLGQVSIGQAYQAYEVYRQLEPSARKVLRVWNWAQWVFNPAAAIARQASQRSTDQANQQLLANLGQLMREAALRNLAQQAIALYSGSNLPAPFVLNPPTLPKSQTQTLREILSQAQPSSTLDQKPINLLLVGRTGAGKSSLINTLFQADLAKVDVLPSTDAIQHYQWQAMTGETLSLWDTPGYEQANREEFRQQVLDYATQADVLLLLTPAFDPALQMDVDFLQDIKTEVTDLPVIAIVTQVDRLRPLREWEPPYDWQWGSRPKEIAIREATEYRAQQLGDWCDRVLPLVTQDSQTGRVAWNADILSLSLLEAIAPAQQLRLARFLRDLETRTVAAAQIIDRYTFQMTTTQGLATLLKSPVLQFISTLTTGSPALAQVLAAQIPVEQLPLVIGKLQMAYDLFLLLKPGFADPHNPKAPLQHLATGFDLLTLWPLLLDNSTSPDRNAWAFGYTLVEHWTQNLTVEQLRDRFAEYGDR